VPEPEQPPLRARSRSAPAEDVPSAPLREPRTVAGAALRTRPIIERLTDPAVLMGAGGLILGVVLTLLLGRGGGPVATAGGAFFGGGSADGARQAALDYYEALARGDADAAAAMCYLNDVGAWMHLFTEHQAWNAAKQKAGIERPDPRQGLAAARKLKLAQLKQRCATVVPSEPRVIDLRIAPGRVMGVEGEVPFAMVIVESTTRSPSIAPGAPAPAPQWELVTLFWLDGRWQIGN